MAARNETPLRPRVSRAQLVARELERDIVEELCGNTPVRGIYLPMIDFLQETVDRAQFPEFDGKAMLTIHRDLVAAIDAGEGPRLDAAVAAHQPTQRLVGRAPRR